MIPWLELTPHRPGAADAPTGGTHDPRCRFADIDRRRGERRKASARGTAWLLRELAKLLEPHGDREASAHREEPLEKTEKRANAQVNLGLVHAQRVEGDRSQNWELAIVAFEDALSGLTRQHNPEEWAEAHMLLGVAYRDRLAGGRSDNQERAIRAFEDCLSVWTQA
jgi:hypothetical protein